MPFDKKLYPADWNAIRARILDRSDGCCECRGACGSAHDGGRCNVPNYAVIKRDPKQPARWEIHRGCSLSDKAQHMRNARATRMSRKAVGTLRGVG